MFIGGCGQAVGIRPKAGGFPAFRRLSRTFAAFCPLAFAHPPPAYGLLPVSARRCAPRSDMIREKKRWTIVGEGVQWSVGVRLRLAVEEKPTREGGLSCIPDWVFGFVRFLW